MNLADYFAKDRAEFLRACLKKERGWLNRSTPQSNTLQNHPTGLSPSTRCGWGHPRSEVFRHALRPTPATGEQSDWLDFCELELKGGSILIVDAQFVPSEKDGLLVALASGKYMVQGKAVNYGGDLRVARLRAFQKGTDARIGAEIGKTWTDTAKTGICDFDIFSKVWGSDDDASYKVIEPFFDSCDDFGIAVFDAAIGAVMPFVHSGFGDGNFSVFELTNNGKRIGFEIGFIAQDEKYPFGETAYQKQNRINEIKRRAEQSDLETQFQLGIMYQMGKEVEKNLEETAIWYEKATINGSADGYRKHLMAETPRHITNLVCFTRLGKACPPAKWKRADFIRKHWTGDMR